ncbi:MAG TPA: GDSL-type esterase/lipase family protein [Dehalococcoidia bacterium]|nr:GDSL-type esterase/lipase family protein [Dehalococcoidia bacterium]
MRICFIGDSFVNGTGDPDCLGWTGRICATARRAGHDLTHYNLGIRRETSAQIRARWREEAFRRLPHSEPAGLVFSFGTNDTTLEDGRERVPPAESRGHAAAILGEAAVRCPVLMVGPPPLADAEQNRRIAALSEQFERLCEQLHVPYLPVIEPLLRSHAWLAEAAAGDGAHPGARGYAELAALVQGWPAWQTWLSGTPHPPAAGPAGQRGAEPRTTE